MRFVVVVQILFFELASDSSSQGFDEEWDGGIFDGYISCLNFLVLCLGREQLTVL
jgi:hypothetical protein